MLSVLPMMTLISLQFPTTPVRRMTDILHHPEAWAAGAGLMAGVPMFQLRDVQGPLTLNKESMVRFDVLGQSVRLMGKYVDKAKITITDQDEEIPHTTIDVSVNAFNNQGCFVVADIISEHYEFDPEMLKNSLQLGLMCCVDQTAAENPVLEMYRQKLLPLKED